MSTISSAGRVSLSTAIAFLPGEWYRSERPPAQRLARLDGLDHRDYDALSLHNPAWKGVARRQCPRSWRRRPWSSASAVSPASMLKLRSLVAVRPPKRLTRAFVSRIGDIVDAPRLSTPGCEAREHRSLGDRGRQGERVVERGVARCDTIPQGGTLWPWRD